MDCETLISLQGSSQIIKYLVISSWRLLSSSHVELVIFLFWYFKIFWDISDISEFAYECSKSSPCSPFLKILAEELLGVADKLTCAIPITYERQSELSLLGVMYIIYYIKDQKAHGKQHIAFSLLHHWEMAMWHPKDEEKTVKSMVIIFLPYRESTPK